MQCSICQLDMKIEDNAAIEVSTSDTLPVTVWKCLNGHQIISSEPPDYPNNLESKEM